MISIMESCLQNLDTKIKCREIIIKQLYSLIGIQDEPMPHSIFIYGHVATGKSLVILHLLKYLRYNFSIVNCIEHVNNKHIFEYILNDLIPNPISNPSLAANIASPKCDNIVTFITKLQLISKYDKRPIVIVLDKCMYMRDTDNYLLPVFLRLKELSNINVCTIFVSNVVWEKCYTQIGLFEPIKIHCAQYTREEVLDILLSYKPKDYSGTIYKNYLNLFLSVFYRFCRDLNELRYMAKINFNKYIEPIKSGLVKEDDVSGLWRNISTTLISNLEVIYLRVSTEDFVQHNHVSKEIESTAKLALSFELPFYAKYILIAAYLASYNPPKEDKAIFMKLSSKKKKKISRKKTTTNIQSGPRSFPISRLLAIFCTILDEKVDVNAILLAQIPTMYQLGLLASIDDNNLDEPKLKCCVNYNFVSIIAKTVGMNIKDYLFNPE
ncbi:origin recognition complex subunit 5 [Vespa velutina]|uniref:origin recognition complex subunit 5 n=1 Tax=Vespa velutina TaxID=202808 RepID=UPI001FB41950|nr:origin recognition complex subunit 5 [Vespa velutina]